MSEGTTLSISYDEYVALSRAEPVLAAYVLRLGEEIEKKDAVLAAIAATPEGMIAMAKVALEKIESINAIIDEVVAKLEAKNE